MVPTGRCRREHGDFGGLCGSPCGCNRLSVSEEVEKVYTDSHLTGIAPSDLGVFVNRTVFKDRENLDPRRLMDDLDEQAPLIVEVPAQRVVSSSGAAAPVIPHTTALNGMHRIDPMERGYGAQY